jgi:predicted nucleic acid-binding protein
MERLAYILDTNVIADYLNAFEPTTDRVRQAIKDQHILYLCQPVLYEVLRGLHHSQSIRKQKTLEDLFMPQLEVATLLETDWRVAAQLWATARSAGKQVSDIDVLITAIAQRMNATIVSADADFDALSVRRVNWR